MEDVPEPIRKAVFTSINLVAEILAESRDCEVDFAVARGLIDARSDEPFPVLDTALGLAMKMAPIWPAAEGPFWAAMEFRNSRSLSEMSEGADSTRHGWWQAGEDQVDRQPVADEVLDVRGQLGDVCPVNSMNLVNGGDESCAVCVQQA